MNNWSAKTNNARPAGAALNARICCQRRQELQTHRTTVGRELVSPRPNWDKPRISVEHAAALTVATRPAHASIAHESRLAGFACAHTDRARPRPALESMQRDANRQPNSCTLCGGSIVFRSPGRPGKRQCAAIRFSNPVKARSYGQACADSAQEFIQVAGLRP